MYLYLRVPQVSLQTTIPLNAAWRVANVCSIGWLQVLPPPPPEDAMNTKNTQEKQAKRLRPSLLDEVLERRMLLYVLAAGATLAGASGAAQSRVVFTPSNVVLSTGSLQIDLNNDGTTDFILDYGGGPQNVAGRSRRRPPGCSSGGFGLYASGATASDGIVDGNGNTFVEALRNGTKIGNHDYFKNSGLMAVITDTTFCRSIAEGYFANTTQRFLGVRFQIDGRTHYGWIGFRSVTASVFITATLYGWAYETQPNTPIYAGLAAAIGKLEKQPAVRSAEPTSLELLAAGHVAVADWRRRNAAVMSSASPS